MDEKQWGKRRRDRERGIERKGIRETVGGGRERKGERGERARHTHNTHAHTGTHTRTRQCEKAQGFTGSSHSPRPQEPPPPAWVPQPGLWPTWLVSNHMEHTGLAFVPNRLWETVGVRGKGALDRALASPATRRGAHHIWVGLVGQPQCPQVKLLFELGLLGVEECELLPDLPAMCPQTLILGVLGVGHIGSAQERVGSWLG